MLVVDGDRSRPDGARLVEARQDFWDASVWYEELPRDVARADAQQRQLDDPAPYVVRKRTSVDEHTAQLVHTRLTWIENDPR